MNLRKDHYRNLKATFQTTRCRSIVAWSRGSGSGDSEPDRRGAVGCASARSIRICIKLPKRAVSSRVPFEAGRQRRGLKNLRWSPGHASRCESFLTTFSIALLPLSQPSARACRCLDALARQASDSVVVTNTTLGGGSLGSCVDEERSQLRELM